MIGKLSDLILGWIQRRARAEELGEITVDAPAARYYGRAEWIRAAKLLSARGLTEHEVEAVLRSGWPLAAIHAERREGRAVDLVALVDKQPLARIERLVRDQRAELTRRTT